MADPLERVVVRLDGSDFSGWSELSVTCGVEQAARTAQLTVSDFAGAMPFRPGAECQLLASGSLLITGYVRDVQPSHEGSRHSVSLSIVSRTIDAVEASIDHPTGFAKQKDLVAIAREFDRTGVGIVADESFPVEPASFVNSGQSLFRHIEPLARSHSALIYDTADGQLRLAKAPRGRHGGGLSIGPGGNIISASATFTEQNRFSPVIVRGQSSRGRGAGALRLEARAQDGSVRRKRPRIIVHESEATSAKLKERAERQVKRAAGHGCSAEIEVSGWRDGDGLLFEPHYVIPVRDARIYLDQDMVIKSVTFSQSIETGGPGTRARLSLADPRALNGEAPAGGGDGSDLWETPETEATIGAVQ